MEHEAFLVQWRKAKFVITKVKDKNRCKLPAIRIDNSLEKYRDKILFNDKLDTAENILKTAGPPKSGRQS